MNGGNEGMGGGNVAVVLRLLFDEVEGILQMGVSGEQSMSVCV